MIPSSRILLGALAALAVQAPPEKPPEQRVWLESGPREKCVDVLFVGDGYTAKELGRAGKYWKDVDRCAKRLFEDPPFSDYKGKFNIRALLLESKATGCDATANEDEVDTALDCRFDARDGRLLVFRDAKKLQALVEASGPTDIVFVMVNTERYGGAGTVLWELRVRERPLPAPTYAAQDTRSFLIAVHELGHSFADLADEYVDKEACKKYPLPEEGDLDRANVSLASAFDRGSFEKLKASVKWRHFLELQGAKGEKWFHEGAYFRESGVFRPWPTCRMNDHQDAFCPICSEELSRAICAACGDPFDDAAWHKAHPLSQWH